MVQEWDVGIPNSRVESEFPGGNSELVSKGTK